MKEEEGKAPEFETGVATPWESSGPNRQDAGSGPCPSVRICPELKEAWMLEEEMELGPGLCFE